MTACNYIETLSEYLRRSCYETLDYPELTYLNDCNSSIQLINSCTLSTINNGCIITINEL